MKLRLEMSIFLRDIVSVSYFVSDLTFDLFYDWMAPSEYLGSLLMPVCGQ
jgi:hypothetical protein